MPKISSKKTARPAAKPAKKAAAKPAAKKAAAKPAKRTAATSAPVAGKPAKLRAWQVASGGSAYRDYFCGGHLLWWVGSKLSSVDARTGKLVAKVEADHGGPFQIGDEMWVPTKTGFTVYSPALKVTRQIETPLPKSPSGGKLRFTSVAYAGGTIACRLAQSTEVTKVGTALQQDYFLCGFDTKSKRQLFVTLLESTSAPQVQGACTADQFAVTFGQGKKTIFGALPAGTITGTTTQAYSNIIVVDGHLVDDPNNNNKYQGSVLIGDAWKKIGCGGVIECHGDRTYAIGFKELAVLDDAFDVVARIPIAWPPEPHVYRSPQTSVCRSGDALLVLECEQPPPSSVRELDNPATYHATWRDPATLAELRSTTIVDKINLRVIGEVDGIHVAEAAKGYVGLRF